MSDFVLVRMTGAIALLSLAFLLVSFDPFSSSLSAAPTSDVENDSTAPMLVNRKLKGDRLPFNEAAIFDSRDNLKKSDRPTAGLRASANVRVPAGCDPAVSPIASRVPSNILVSCTT
jgi:hypothetical protein